MKLNNKGWGTLEMLLLSGGLLIALLIAVFFIYKLYGSIGNSIENKIYLDLESNLEVAAKNYIDDNNIKVNGEYRISFETLKSNNYIDELKDGKGKNCDGYVIVSNVDNIDYYNGYVLCKGYQTLNY